MGKLKVNEEFMFILHFFADFSKAYLGVLILIFYNASATITFSLAKYIILYGHNNIIRK